MRSSFTLGALALLLSGCLDLKLPDPPGPPAPGAVSGRAVMVPPGRAGVIPVPNARVELLGTGLQTTSDSSGFFRIGGVVREAKQLLFRADLDGDGRADRQKLLTLDAARVGPGKQVALGDVLLAENATVRGQVLLGDVSTPSGHAGTLVFVPEGPFTATTSDDGRFVFNELPEGTLSLAFFRAGYRTRSFDAVSLSSGQELTLRAVTLTRETTTPQPVSITGRIRLADGGPAPQATVVLSSADERRQLTTDDEGRYDASGLVPGVFSLTATRDGALPSRVSNIAALSGRVELFDIVLTATPATGMGGGAGGGGFIDELGGGAGGGTAGGSAGGTAGGSAGGTSGGFAGGTSGGTSGGTGGGTSGGASGGSSGGTSGGASGGSSGGTSGGASGGSSGGSSGGASGGSSGGSSGGASGGTAGGSAGGMAVPQPPAPPTNLTATPGDGQITLTFTPTPGATSHRLYFSNQPTVSRTTGTLLGTVTSPTLHQGLMNGVTWYYVVTALNAAGESAESEVASAIPSSMAGQTSPQVLVRRPLAGVNGVRVGTRVDARFDRDLDGVSVTTANVTLARLDGGIVTGSTTSAGPSLAFTPSLPLAFETSYRVTLGTGLRDTLNQNLAAPDSWTFTTGAPPPVVTAYAGNGAATITWTAVPGATHYVVTHLVVPSLAEEHTVTGTVFTETSMSNGQIHTFSVAAVTSFGRGTASNEVPITAQPSRPGIPSSLEVSVGHTTALLTWSPVSNATGYTIYRANDPGGPFTVAESGFQGTTWLDSNLPASPVWAYVVQAESAGGTGAWARAVAGSTDPSRLPAPNVTASAGNGWVRLTWAAVPGAEEYVVLRGTWPNNNPARLGTAAGTRFDDLVAYNGQTYRYFVGAVGADQVVGDLVEETVSPVAGLPLPAPVMSWPAVEVNRVSLSAASLVAGTTQQFFRAPTPDGGFVPVSSIETIDGGTTWYYAARSSLGGVTSELSLPIAVTHAAAVVPAMPQNVTAFVASGSADVAFDPVPNATGYQVGSSTSPGGTPTVRCSTADPWENRCLVSLTDNQTVYLSVRALNGSTPGPWSSEVMARPTNFGPTAGLPAPSLEATFGNGIATVSWTHVPGATEYRVFRRTRSSPFVLLGTTSALSLTDSTVINGTDYRYALLATNGTSRFAPTQLTVFDQPSALELRRPTNVTVTPTNNGALVRWRPVAGAVSYGVRASTFTGGAPSAYDTSCTSPDPYGTTCQLNLANFTPYSVQVIAYGPGGTRSAWTDAVPVTPTPAAPAASPGLALTAANGRLVLTASTTAGASYRLFRRTPDTPFVGLGLFPTPFFSESQPNGVAFQYALQVVTAQGESPLAITPFVSPSDSAPPPPVLREVSAGDGTAWVWWEPVEGASSYTVMTAPGPDGPYSAAVSVNSARQTTTTITSLTNGTPVWVAVAATSASGTSARSTELMAQPAASTLDAPIVTLINGNQAVQLSWPTVAGATGYQVLRRPADGAWSTAASLTARRFTDLDVENGESWQYQVRAVGPAGPGPGSGASPSQSVLASIPTVPTGVTVRPANGGLFVEWAPSPLATGYFVSLSPEADGPLTPVCNVTGQWETRCLAITTAARFVFVQALAPGETSIASAPRPGTPDPALPAQGSLSVSAPGPAGSLQVTWFAVSGATGYRVYRRPLNGAATQVHQTTTTTPFVDTGLTSGQTYVYYLEAENAAGRGAWSTPDSEVAP